MILARFQKCLTINKHHWVLLFQMAGLLYLKKPDRWPVRLISILFV
ncbi:hypothetical protein D068_cds12010 [Bacillus atrophaeus UCMB-5137]|nr:hypothetical protein D068_cds12010 [Bacillus atrophaeus UCMB-5137]